MNRKGVELSMNLIIVAVIALLVLVVVILIFSGTAGKFSKGISDCSDRGGNLESRSCDPNTESHYALADTSTEKCCIPKTVFTG